MKLGVLLRAGQLGAEELARVPLMQQARALASDRCQLPPGGLHSTGAEGPPPCSNAGTCWVRPGGRAHLTAKSHGRINHVFGHLANCDFLAAPMAPPSLPSHSTPDRA